MATTINGSFQEFRSNLEVTPPQQSSVSGRQQAVRQAVARRLTVLDSFLTGSYRRHTMIAPLSEADIDIFVVLDPSYYTVAGFGALLNRVRSVLLETYTRTPHISRNGQAVTIRFTDFVVDVVPAFYRIGGGYLIPSTTESRWIETNPRLHEPFISNANAAHNQDLVPLIKMIKAWNRSIGGTFRSFYLELLVEKVLRGIRIDDFPSGCRYVFDKGREAVRYTIGDPSGLGNQVSGLAAARTVTAAVSRFQTAYLTAQRAEQIARLGSTQAAITQWRGLFGGSFPAYG